MKNPNEIEVVDPEFVTTEKNVDRFYNWLHKIGNEYIGNNERMERAFNLITE